MLHEAAKVYSVHSKVGNLGDYLFDGFKETAIRINKIVLNYLIPSNEETVGCLLHQRAGHELVAISIGYEFTVLWMNHV